MKFIGTIKKMKSQHCDPIIYQIPIDDKLVPISDFLNKTIKIDFLEEIHCIECDKKINKTFAQGYCYPCFIQSPNTSECILGLSYAGHMKARPEIWSGQRSIASRSIMYIYH